MHISLQIQFKTTVVKYNYNDPFKVYSEIDGTQPSESEMKEILKRCDEAHPEYAGYATTIHTEQFYKVTKHQIG